MNAIDSTFERLRTRGHKAFIPFVTAGDPDLATTTALVQELAARGADLIEIGFPYSDPIADGPVIQASYARALGAGIRIGDLFAWASRLACPVPLLGMVSYTLIHRRGAEAFVRDAQAAGFSGLIVPDLPVEEAEALAGLTARHNLRLVLLVTPTTPAERAARIIRSTSGFLYVVSVAGITGERSQLPEELRGQLIELRGQTDLPLCVGFGISKPEHVRLLRDVADGLIVGSAIVRHLEALPGRPLAEVVRQVGELAESLGEALNPRT